jgi:hypothetical protein
MKPGLVVVLIVAGWTAAACNSNSGPTTSPAPSAPSVTETFTGTVPVGGSDSHQFVVAQGGEVDVTLTAAGPPATIFMGIGLGAPSTATCPHTFGELRSVQAGPNIAGNVFLNAGTYCVDVFDVGNQAVPVTYTVTVAHP